MLNDNDIQRYLIHYEAKPFVAEKFIRTLQTKIQIHDFSITKCVY